MTVAELIKKLQEHDQNLTVKVSTGIRITEEGEETIVECPDYSNDISVLDCEEWHSDVKIGASGIEGTMYKYLAITGIMNEIDV
jgi:hypothetical protein